MCVLWQTYIGGEEAKLMYLTITNSLYILINTLYIERARTSAGMSGILFEGIHYYIQSTGVDLLEDFRTNLDVSLLVRV